MNGTLRLAPLLLLFAARSWAQAPISRIEPNQNRVAAGELKDGVLTLHMDVTHGMWFLDGDKMPGIDVLAFAESGKAPTIPAPLIRVPVGTEVHATIHNTLTDSSFTIEGVKIAPGETRDIIMHAKQSGTYLYRAYMGHGRDARQSADGTLAGAFVVDDPHNMKADRVLVLLQLLDSARVKSDGQNVDELLTINGLSWPNTELLEYNLGETIRWRVVNASFDTHPMHLHGAYYDVLSRGTATGDTVYAAAAVRKVVTERMTPLTTMMMEWQPAHAGNWIFHCHLTFHAMPHVPLGPMKASDEHMMMGMGGLVIGTRINGVVAKDTRPRRNLRLHIEQYDSVLGEFAPRFSYRLDDARTMTRPGPPIVVTKDEPVAITVLNDTKSPASVHWHGLEIESYYDGVHDFGGDPRRTSPVVNPGDSFVVNMTPPHAGTFIYHTHVQEARQQSGGLYGAFIVLDKNEKWDPDYNRVIIFGTRPDSTLGVDINGSLNYEMSLTAGKTYRLRLINITLDRPSMIFKVLRDGKPVEWKMLAMDGAILPPSQAVVAPSSLQITIGKTYDVLFKPEPGEYRMDVTTGAGALLRSAHLIVKGN